MAIAGKGSILRHRPGVIAQAAFIAVALGTGGAALAATTDLPTSDASSVPERMAVEVVSAGRHSQHLGDVADAVFVITREDLLRSGVRAWPEALRMAPGVDVARVGADQWSVGVRGAAGRSIQPLQVMVDGRSIVSPLTSGVAWETQQIPLADIERIEVRRGPAGAAWGGNATQGVIHIITRQVQDNRRPTVSMRMDGDDHRTVYMGGAVGPVSDEGGWRLSAHGDGVNAYDTTNGASNDDARHLYFSARFDGRTQGGARLSGQTIVQRSDTGATWAFPDLSAPYARELAVRQVTDRLVTSGSYVRALGLGEELKVTAYGQLEHATRTGWDESQNQTVAVEGQRSWLFAPSRQKLTVGLGTQVTHDRLKSGGGIDYTPEARWIRTWSAFGQDEIRLVPDKWWLTVGARVDSHPDTGVRTSPSATLSWRESPSRLFWSSLSRATRVPSREMVQGNHVLAVTAPSSAIGAVPTLWHYQASTAPVVEEVTAWQIGLRSQVSTTLSWDAVGFVHQMSPLAYLAPTAAAPQPVAGTVPYQVASVSTAAGKAQTTGVEASLDWVPARTWRVQASAAVMGVRSESPANSVSNGFEVSPRQLLSVRTSVDATDMLALQAWLRYTGKRFGGTTLTSVVAPVDAFTTLDLTARWQYQRDVAITLAARNLGPAQRIEVRSTGSLAVPVQAPPTLGAKVDISF